MARVLVPRVPNNLRVTSTVRLIGMRDYAQRLQRLGDGMIERGCVVALAPGADLLRDAVRARAPVLQQPDPRRKPFTLKNAIVAMRSKATRFAVTYVVGIRLLKAAAITRFKKRSGRGASENPDDPFYGTILEYGRTPRTMRPFLRPAFSASARPAVEASFNRLKSFTDSEIRRIGAGG